MSTIQIAPVEPMPAAPGSARREGSAVPPGGITFKPNGANP